MADESKDAAHIKLDDEGYLLDADGNRELGDDDEPILFKRQSEVNKEFARLKNEVKRLRTKAQSRGNGEDGASTAKVDELEGTIADLQAQVSEKDNEIKRLGRQLEKEQEKRQAETERADKAVAESDDEFINNQLLAAANEFYDPRDAVLNLRSVAKLERDEKGKRRVVFPMPVKDEKTDEDVEKDLSAKDAVARLGELNPRYVKGNSSGGPDGQHAGGDLSKRPWKDLTPEEQARRVEKYGRPSMEEVMEAARSKSD